MKAKFMSKFLICVVLIAVLTGTFLIVDYLNSKNTLSVNYQTQIIKTEKLNYASLIELFDEISTKTDENGTKIVTSTLKLKGDDLDNLTYTADSSEQNVTVSSTTEVDVNGVSTAAINFDFGDTQEQVLATSDVQIVDDAVVGTVIIDGVEYEVSEILAQNMGEDGVQECWFGIGLFFRAVFVVVTVILAAQYAVDVFKYISMEEITMAGVMLLVVEGLQFLPGGVFAKSVAKVYQASGAVAVKAAKTATGKYMMHKSKEEILEALIKTRGSENVANGKHFTSHEGLTKHFKKEKKERPGYEVHHLVEQRLVKNFGKDRIHNTGNAIRIPKVMHTDINKIFTTQTPENKRLFKEITGHDVGNKSIREYLDNLTDFDEQYRIGAKVAHYCCKGKNYEIDYL